MNRENNVQLKHNNKRRVMVENKYQLDEESSYYQEFLN